MPRSSVLPQRVKAVFLVCALSALWLSLYHGPCRSHFPKWVARIHAANFSHTVQNVSTVPDIIRLVYGRLNTSSLAESTARSFSYPAAHALQLDFHERSILLQAQNLTGSSPFRTKWLCLIIVNQAYIPLFENWVCSLRNFGGTQVMSAPSFMHIANFLSARILTDDCGTGFGVHSFFSS